jgi:hypothetical protein
VVQGKPAKNVDANVVADGVVAWILVSSDKLAKLEN